MAYVVWKIKEIAQMALKRIANEFDCIICFCGVRGNSKSTGAYKLGLALHFKPKRDIIYDRDKLIKALNDWDRVIDADEMINSAYKREFYQADQISLIKLLNMYRDHRHVLIFSIPNFWDLDKPMRDMVKIRIDMIRRGVGVVHFPLQLSYTNDAWDTKLNQKIERKFVKSNNIYKPNYRRLTTFAGYLRFGKLTTKQELNYKFLKNLRREELRIKNENENPSKKKLDNIYDNMVEAIKEGSFIDMKPIEMMARLNNTKYSLMKTHIQNRLKDAGLPTLMSLLKINKRKFESSIEYKKFRQKNEASPSIRLASINKY